MPKERWRKSFKSIIDPEKDEQLRGTKTEIDGKVQKIFEFLKEEDGNDRKESLADLIGDFHNYYESLYARYDHLTEKLRKKVHGNGGSDSSSSSSDSSDSDDSPRKKGKRNGEVEHNFENNNSEVGDLKRRLAAAIDENEALYLEYQRALSKSQEAQRIIMDLNTEGEKLGAANEELSTLKVKLGSAENKIIELNQMQKAAEEENTGLSSKILQLEEEIRGKSQEISEFLIQTETLKEELENRIAEQQKTMEEKQNLVLQVKDLNLELNSVSNLKHELEEELRSKNEDLIQLEEENTKLQIRSSEMEKALSETEKEIFTLKKKYEDGDREASAQIIEQERKLKEQNDAFIKLSEEHKQLEVQFRNCEESLKSSENEIEQLRDQFRKGVAAKNQDINQLEENIEDLKIDLEMKEDEINTLVENMRTTEVKQRLTSQKLRLTEQLLGEMEESHQKRVEKLQEEQKLLEERIATLSGIISTYKETQVKMVTDISEKINETLMGIDTFSVKFEEDYGHLESRVYEITNELKVVINWITGNNAEKDQRKKEIASLLEQLKDEKEQGLLLTVKIVELETILRKDEDERKSLIQTVQQREEKMGEMEKMIEERDEKMGELEREMNEKDSGILSLSEEKREAIRQLCIWIDYHHNRYDDLRDIILKTRGGRRQIAA